MTDYHFKKFLDQVTPLENFDDEIPPEAPNYADLLYWAATPDQEAQQFFIPDDSFKVNKKGNPVDVFYIHPTGFYEKKWNSNMDRKRSAFERTEIMLGNQASVFNESCNIYAPEYRQATYFSFFDKNKNGIKALDLAYSDIENAFDYFIEHFNDDKPFIIAGHSQGALHTHRLIKQRIENSSLQKRFICAYAIGYMIPEKSFNDLFPTIKKSEPMSFSFFPLAGLSELISSSIASALPPANAWETTLLGSRMCSSLLPINTSGSTTSTSKSLYC